MQKKYTSLEQVQSAISSGKLSLVELVNHYLENIKKRNDELNVFLEVFEDEALETAAAYDKSIAEGRKPGRLFGMIFGIKDVICLKGHKVSASSKMLENFESIFTATAVERLIAEGAIVLGRLNCDEFAMGSTSEHSFFGPTRNAADPTKVPGGSSGGSAVAVQADMCLAALGSDTGGSVRQPASFCGVFGFKPTYGTISRHGLIAYASSFDQIGVLSNSVEDAALMVEVMAGKDDFDSTLSQRPVPAFSQEIHPEKKFKIAYIKEAMETPGLDPEIRTSIEELIEKLKGDGHEVVEVNFPYLDYVVPAYYVMTCAEASSNLSRYDGIHFGYRNDAAKNLKETYQLTRTHGFGKEVRRRIMLGNFVLSSGFSDAYFSKAQKVRRLVSDATQEILKDHDFILSPTTPTTAFGIGELTNQDPTTMYLADIYTVQPNLAGIPSVSVPLFQHSNSMPFGLQLMANKFEESKLFSFSKYLMKG